LVKTPGPLKGKGTAMYESGADAIILHFSEEDVRSAVEWLKAAVDSDVLLKSGIMPESERLLFEKIDDAFSDVTKASNGVKKEEKK
jgi:hypothetical protein